MKLTKTVGSFSLLNSQMTVGVLTRSDGTELKGFTLGLGNMIVDFPFPLPDSDAQVFVDCLTQVERKALPVSFRFRFGLWNLSSVSFVFRQYDPKWFHGGGIKGSVTYAAMLGLKWIPMEMSIEAVAGLKACLQQFYGLSHDGVDP